MPHSSASVNTARSEILKRTRNAQRIVFEGRGLISDVSIIPGEPGAHFDISRDYGCPSDLTAKEIISLTDERITNYKADVCRCGNLATDTNEAMKKVVADVGTSLTGISGGLDREWVTGLGGAANESAAADSSVELRVDIGLAAEVLDELNVTVIDSVVTRTETGTIFLDSPATFGRRALILVLDIHIYVVPTPATAYSILEAVSHLHESNPIASITVISGPPAASDIKLSRAEGIHGPHTLIVVVAGQ